MSTLEGPHDSMQGRQEGGVEGAVCQRTSGCKGPYQLISKFLFIASLDVLKEPSNTNSLQGFKSVSRFSSPDSLAFCPFCSLRSQTQGSSFCRFAPGPRKHLGGPDLRSLAKIFYIFGREANASIA